VLRFYNTLSRTKEAFTPIDSKNVRLYVCGPTVYDLAHIGNARPVIVFDIVFRLLRHVYGFDHVTYVRNITDVDDKINQRAFERGISISELTAQTTQQFHKDIQSLGVLMPEDVNEPHQPPRFIEPRATDHIEDMKILIERLVKRGFAYVAKRHVLFSVSAMRKYGALARRSLDEMLSGARVEVADYKRDGMDFVLWKPSKANEPSWPSPCGIVEQGRPGWHIECSAMSWRHLIEAFAGRVQCDDPAFASTFDIHGGGIDLVFPHHENEIAQSCCAFDAPKMANVWMHNGFLMVEGEKMSKSLGNFITIHQLLETDSFGGRLWHGEILRLAMLKTHYRQPIDWTVKGLEECAEELSKWSFAILDNEGVLNRRFKQYIDSNNGNSTPEDIIIEHLSNDLDFSSIRAYLNHQFEILKDSLDTKLLFMRNLYFLGFKKLVTKPGLFEKSIVLRDLRGDINEITKHIFPTINLRAAYANDSELNICAYKNEIKKSGYIAVCNSETGEIDLKADKEKEDQINKLVEERNAARLAKNWSESDRLRDELTVLGVLITDYKDGTTTWTLG
jgi:cysteinyl-tRNA synthetase